MITITTPFKNRHSAFTLVELMVGASLSTIVLLGVITTFLMLGRSGANIGNYSVMEMQSRKGLEELSQDIRMAKNIIWSTPQCITLDVPDNYLTTDNKVTYAYNSSTKIFYRVPGTSASGSPKTTLVSDVSSFEFARFNRLDVATSLDQTTKRIQLTMVVKKQSKTVAAATNTILSASFILRNKLVN